MTLCQVGIGGDCVTGVVDRQKSPCSCTSNADTAGLVLRYGTGGVRSRPSIVNPMNRETTHAMYITPANDSRITNARAMPVTGRMSLRPTLERTATLR